MSNSPGAIQTQMSPYCTHSSGAEQVAACDVESSTTCKWQCEYVNANWSKALRNWIYKNIMLIFQDDCKWTAVGGLLIIHSLSLEVNKFINTKSFSVISADADFVDYFGFDVISRQINSFDSSEAKTE